jgi:transcriptional regulator with GAF, ATPase, and Fis domain
MKYRAYRIESDMPALRAVAGPLKGAAFQVSAEEITIGRQASSQLCVGDPSVSRQHCIIEPSVAGLRIRDLGSNNGTFVNGKRVEECILADGDTIRIGDTLFNFAENAAAEQTLKLLDNGVVADSRVERQVSESAETVIGRLFESAARGGDFAGRAKAFLRIGAALNTWREPEAIQTELLKQILEAVPADRAAIVLLGRNPDDVPAVTGWDRRSKEVTAVPVSRTLVTQAIRDNAAIFSDDVRAEEPLADVSSLTGRNVVSVIAVPLTAEETTIGAIYLESTVAEKPLNHDDLEFVTVVAEFAGTALERVRRLRVLKEENQRLQSALQLEHNLIGVSPGMRQISERIARIAHTDATVMIRGETGTGKELAARAIHRNSARAARPFEAVNCSLLRDTLLESDLFGHEKGSFTGAVVQKRGRLELADGGTLFMDELAELGEGPQAMLLRVLQTREFQRLGGSRTIRADVRIIAATNEDLEEGVRNKNFRQDLYYRLNVVSLTMPPLRERREDIPLLADHFLQIYSRKNKREVIGVSTAALTLLTQHDWPGNVRELENAIEHAVVFGFTDEILPEDLPDSLLGSRTAHIGASLGYHDAVREAKRNIVRSAMEKASDNYSEAAKLLGIHVNNLHRLIRELELRRSC